jgi:superfamily II DNA helicase RecQ
VRAGELDSNSAWRCGACDSCVRGTERLKDYAGEAQKLLSAYQELGKRMSAAKVLHVLRGSRAKDIAEWTFALPIHGQGKERSVKYWQGLSRSLEDVGLLQSKTISFDGGGAGPTSRTPDRRFTPSYLTCSITAKGQQWLLSAAKQLPKLELVESDELRAEDREQQEAKRREEVCM